MVVKWTNIIDVRYIVDTVKRKMILCVYILCRNVLTT